MDSVTIFTLILTTIALINSTVALFVSIVSVLATMTLLRYARREQALLDQVIITIRELSTAVAAVRAQIELAIWRT